MLKAEKRCIFSRGNVRKEQSLERSSLAQMSSADPESDGILRNQRDSEPVRVEDQAWLCSYPSLERGQEGWEFLRVTLHSCLQGSAECSPVQCTHCTRNWGALQDPASAREKCGMCREETSHCPKPPQSLLSMSSHDLGSSTHLGQDRCCPPGHTWNLQ